MPPLASLDVSSPEARSAERYRRIAWSTAAGLCARLTGLAVAFVSVPLLLSYLGSERYGLWLTLASVVAMIGPLDLGISNGLATLIASARGRGERREVQELVSTGFAFSIGLAASLVVALVIAYRFVPWAKITNVGSDAATTEAGPAAAALLVCFAIGIPLGLASRIHDAFQEGFFGSLWLALGHVVGFVLLVLAISSGGGVATLMVAALGGPLLAAALNMSLLFVRQRPWLRPSRHLVRGEKARVLLRTGFLFVVLQLSLVVGYQSDAIVIAQILGPESVPNFSIPMRLFLLAPMFLSLALAPLWPAYSEALARRDLQWVNRTLRRSIVVATTVNVPSAAVLFLSAPSILSLWVGDAVSVSTLLLSSLAIWLVLNSLNGPLSMLLLGANALRFLAITSVLMAIVNIAISIFLVGRIGIAGAVIGTIVAQTLFILIPWSLYAARVARGAMGSSKEDQLQSRT